MLTLHNKPHYSEVLTAIIIYSCSCMCGLNEGRTMYTRLSWTCPWVTCWVEVGSLHQQTGGGCSSRDSGRGTMGQTHPTRAFQAPVCVMLANIPRTEASHRVKHNFKGTEKYTLIMKVGERDYLLKTKQNKTNLPFLFQIRKPRHLKGK